MSLALVVAAWAVPVVGGCALVLAPRTGLTWALISTLVTTGSPWMVVPALTGVLLLVIVAWVGWRFGSLLVALVTVLAFAMAVVPLVDSATTAAANGVHLSMSRYLQPAPPVSGPDSTEVYATVGGTQLRLDVWRPARPAPNGPAIVWVHGGGWIEGSRGQSPDRNQWLVDQGYTVFDVDYRLSGPRPMWRAQTGDVKCALGWVLERADRYGINPGAISVGGDSAGGNLAMLAAYTVGTGQFPPSCPALEVKPRSVISFYGPTDNTALPRDSGAPDLMAEVARKHFGGSVRTVPEAYRATSPLTYVRRGLPPTLLIHGEVDHLVPASQASRMATALDRAGVQNRLLMLPWAEHVFDGTWGMWQTQISYGVLEQFLRTE